MRAFHAARTLGARLRVRARALLETIWADAFLRRLARHSSWGLAASAIELVLSLAETTLVARALGVTDYGRLALVMASIASVKQFLDARAWEGATRYLAEFLQRGERALALATLKLALLVDAAVAVIA
jgi:O-antigen/teichoic acid export membrane protein